MALLFIMKYMICRNLIGLANKNKRTRHLVGFHLLAGTFLEISRCFFLTSPIFQQSDWSIQQCLPLLGNFTGKTSKALFASNYTIEEHLAQQRESFKSNEVIQVLHDIKLQLLSNARDGVKVHKALVLGAVYLVI